MLQFQKPIIYFISLAVMLFAGISIGYFYHDYRYGAEIAAGKNWEATQYLDSIAYPDVTSRVQIICNFGNKQTFDAKETNLKFTQKDFDADENFIGHDKNFLIQQVCGISNSEGESILNQAISDNTNIPILFNLKLNR